MKTTVRKLNVPDSFLELACVVEEKTSFTVLLVSPRHWKLREYKSFALVCSYDDGGEIYVANLPQAVQFLGHETTHILLEEFFNYYKHETPLDRIMSDWVADWAGAILSRCLGGPYHSYYKLIRYGHLVAEFGFTEEEVSKVFNNSNLRKWVRKTALNVVREILSWIKEKRGSQGGNPGRSLQNKVSLVQYDYRSEQANPFCHET